MKTCWVEIQNNRPVRIFKTKKAATKAFLNGTETKEMYYSDAVRDIRKQVVARANGECEWCSASINEFLGHLHEVVFRSKGGEISIFNSVFICPDCHLNGAHKNRRWQLEKM